MTSQSKINKVKKRKNTFKGLAIFGVLGIVVLSLDGDIKGSIFYIAFSLVFYLPYRIYRSKEDKLRKKIENQRQARNKFRSKSKISTSMPNKEYIPKKKNKRHTIVPQKIEDYDNLSDMQRAIQIIIKKETASISMLQVYLGISYEEAALMIGYLENENAIYKLGSEDQISIDIVRLKELYQTENFNLVKEDFKNKAEEEKKKQRNIAFDFNIINQNEDLEKVLEYVINLDSFDMKKFQDDFDYTFQEVSSYLDTLRALELIDESNKRINLNTSLTEVKTMINEAITNTPDLISTYKLDNLEDGYEFESFIAELLKKLDYDYAKVTKASNDFGVDVLAEKNGVTFAIQCKYYSSSVGNTSVQEIVSGMTHYDAHVGVVATNNYFTKQAKQLAQSNKILLWDRDILINMINLANEI